MKKNAYRMIVGLTSAAVGAAAVAAPPTNQPPLGPAARAALGPGGPIDGLWSDNFDSYAAGSALTGQGAWAPWCTGGVDGLVSTTFAASAPNSFRAAATTDMVQEFSGATSGTWVFRVKTYVPSTASGSGFVIVMNNYCPGANSFWSVVCELSKDTGLAGIYVNGLPNGATLPLITDQWVEYKAEIDLTADTLKEYYGGTLFTTTAQTWTGNVQAGGTLAVRALDLYSATMDGIYYDDAALEGGSCYPDCNGVGGLTIADFGCFQTKFVAGCP